MPLTILLIVLFWLVTGIPFVYISVSFDLPFWANVFLIQTSILISNEIAAQIGPKPFKTAVSVVLTLPKKDRAFFFSIIFGVNILFPIQAFFLKELSNFYALTLVMVNLLCVFGLIRLFGSKELRQAIFTKPDNDTGS